VAVVGRDGEMTPQVSAPISRESLGKLLAPSLPPLAEASQRLRRRPGRPRKPVSAVACQASALPATPPLTRANARAVAVVWLKRGPEWIPASARLLGLAAAAAYMGVSTWTIRRWIGKGLLARVRLPGAEGGEVERLLFDVNDLDALIDGGKP
jgi:hypothetical protein